jgi:hypothetical protein
MNQFVSPFEKFEAGIKVSNQLLLIAELQGCGESLGFLDLAARLPALFGLREGLQRLKGEEEVVNLLLKVRGVQGHEAQAPNNVSVVRYWHAGWSAGAFWM